MTIPSFSNLTIQYSILFVLICVGLTSCETISEIELPEEKSQLVVNAIYNADSLVKVDLTQSQPVNTSGFHFAIIENASVEVFKNSVSLGFLDYKGKGKYLSKAVLPNEPGTEYSLKVKATGFETAETSEIMPGKPEVGILTYKDVDKGSSYYKSYKASFTLNDAPEDNFYFMKMWLQYKDNAKGNVYFSLNNTLGQFVPVGRAASEIYLFDDKSFNGRSVTFDLDIIGVYTDNCSDCNIVIELGNTSKNYFNYQFDVKKQFNSSDVFSPEKNPVSNNIKNGLGIFAPYNSAA
ncbi:MAG: DUF4249 domain-containing protein, partial [Daejeonella sp.]